MKTYFLQAVVCGACLLLSGCPPDGISMKLASSKERLPRPSFAVTYDKGMRGSIRAIRCTEFEPNPRGAMLDDVWHAVFDGDFGERSPVFHKLVYGVAPSGFTNKVAPKPLKPGGHYVISVGKGGKVQFRVDSDGLVSVLPVGE